MFRSLFATTAFALAALTTTPVIAGGHGCQSVQFARGAYAHTMYGEVNSHQSQCYYLAVRPGQRARVRIVYGAAYLSTTHTNGNFQDVQFNTINGQLYVHVHTDYPGQQAYSIEFVFI